MNKILLNLFLLLEVSFSATTEQVQQYVMVSKADADLILVEQMIDEIMPSDSSKNTETITIRFNEYLEKNLTENEIEELIKLHKNPLLQTLRELDSDLPEEELLEFNATLKENPLSSERLDLNKQIILNMFNNEDLKKIMHGIESKFSQILGQKEEFKLFTKTDEKKFIEEIQKELRIPILYSTQTLSIEELKELESLTDRAIMRKANKIELNATMYALDEFLQTMVQNTMDSFLKDAKTNSPLLEILIEE